MEQMTLMHNIGLFLHNIDGPVSYQVASMFVACPVQVSINIMQK